jgi:hypothetical protein
MKRIALATMVAAFSLVAVPSALAAKPLTFDEQNGTGNPIVTSIVSGNFTFTSAHEHIIGEPGICLFGGCVSNGTTTIAEEAGGVGQPITMAVTGGGEFKLKWVDAAPLFNDSAAASIGGVPNATQVYVVGTTSGGGTVSATLVLNGNPEFQSFKLPSDFKNLVSVTFYGNNASNTGGFQLDNIKAND